MFALRLPPSFPHLQKGHFYTSFGAFFIEPIEAYTDDNQLVLHRITRLLTQMPSSSSSPSSSSDAVGGGGGSNRVASNVTCDVTGDNAAQPSATGARRRKRSIPRPSRAAPHTHYQPQPQPNNAYTMKVLVGVDTKMQEYHRGRNLKEYILTLMNIVCNSAT